MDQPVDVLKRHSLFKNIEGGIPRNERNFSGEIFFPQCKHETAHKKTMRHQQNIFVIACKNFCKKSLRPHHALPSGFRHLARIEVPCNSSEYFPDRSRKMVFEKKKARILYFN